MLLFLSRRFDLIIINRVRKPRTFFGYRFPPPFPRSSLEYNIVNGENLKTA